MREDDELLWGRYLRDMKARNLSQNTIDNYRGTIVAMSAMLPGGVAAATEDDIAAWLARVSEGAADASAAAYFARSRAYFNWLHGRELIEANPMARMRSPKSSSPLIPVPEMAELVKVLAECARDKSYRGRRDYAIMRLLLETGTPRCKAIADLLTDHVDLKRDTVKVLDKGSKERELPIGSKCGTALTLYLRARSAHPMAAYVPQLFLGRCGRMTRDGIYQTVEHRCELAGVPVISPHKWRHFTANEWFAAGGSITDAMALFGWSSPTMAHRYAGSAAAKRAQQHSRDLGLADRI